MSKMSKDTRRIRDMIKSRSRPLVEENKVKQTAFGYKAQNGELLEDTESLICYVRAKLDLSKLRSYNIESIPKEIDGITTDVVEIKTGFMKRNLLVLPQLVAPDDRKHRPVTGGVAMMNTNGVPSTGTLGLIVQKRNSDEKFGLTNNHVGANEDLEGLPPTANKGDPWIQPGAHGDGQHPQDTMGSLESWKKMISEGSGINYYDVSIGKMENTDILPYNVMEIGSIEGSADIELGDRAIKRGRTTRRTIGKVTAVDVRTYVAYQGVSCYFEDQVEVTGIPREVPFSLGGDSGSVVCEEESPYRIKGQLFAGGEDADGIDRTIVSPIRRIIDDFTLDL
jgi:hypothetical protein